jgi:hypothetical protein
MFKPLFFIVWITVIVVFGFFTRWWVDDKHRSPQHVGHYIIRVMLAFLNSFLWFDLNPNSMLNGEMGLFEQLWAMREWFTVMALQGALFWDGFDPLLNYLRGKPGNYVSKSNRFDAFFHRFNNPFIAQLATKAVLTGLLILALVLI